IKRFTVNQSKVTLPLNNICPGIYTIKVYTSKGIQIKKFVKK
ncbi:MAG: T9SS type A sorting domain-containing protein, partial [Bacteroidales bacterium]|nr:T9SS type A sorting domain-containing protein [Bacteroidales bacterium]